MVSFTLNGLSATITNATDFVATTAAAVTALDAPELDLTMSASAWNTVFSFGEATYHTYSAELPVLVHATDNKTLATKELTSGTGNKALQEPEETSHTLSEDVVRHFIFKITGARNQSSLYSNISTVTDDIDALLIGTGASSLAYNLKASLDSADGKTDSDTTGDNLGRQLKLLTLSGAPTRLEGEAAGDIYHASNLLSNLVGDLTGVTSGDTDAVLTTGFTLTGGTGTGAVIGSVTIRGGKIVGVVFSTAGSGYVATDVLSITHEDINSGTAVTYTLVGGDLDNDGGFTNGLYNFLFSANDILNFQITIAPLSGSAYSNQASKTYAIKITME
tara:strand:- start:702 stop:1700 length:999 start_codon:yes stop_codon:yes gene_type:complete